VNSIAPALKVLIREGMNQSEPIKLRKALQEIDRDSRRYGWTDDIIETMPPEWQHRVACARLQMGHLDWRGFQWRIPRDGHDNFPFPKWKLGLPVYPHSPECKEPEKVGNLLIYAEQGLGDQLMFAQAFDEVRPYAENVTIEVEPRLEKIFKRRFPYFHIHPIVDIRDFEWATGFDAKVLMGDVVARFRRSKESFTSFEMTADPEMIKKWSHLKGVGCSFHGRQADLDPKIFGKDWINLQYGEYKSDLFTPDIDLTKDIEDIFGILANLVRVVTVPNTLAHMAGVLNIPCDVIATPGAGEVNNSVNWRWGMPADRKMVWHKSITIYRNVKQYESSQ